LVGLWIPNIFYWGCNQFITQRALAAKNIREAQNGLIFAGFLKLLVPFIVVIPGIIAYTLYAGEIERADMSYPFLIQKLIPPGLLGIIFAALLAAVMSSLSSMLNSCATIFTVDIYKRYSSGNPSEHRLVSVGRIATIVVLVIATVIAPFLTNFQLIFSYIQKFWGFISPGVVVVFMFGIFWNRATAAGAITSLSLSVPVYALLQVIFPEMAFLNQMTISLLVLSTLMVGVSLVSRADFSKSIQIGDYGSLIKTAKPFNIASIALILMVVTLYIVFF